MKLQQGMPAISVVIAVQDATDTVWKCVEAIQSELDSVDAEIIVVDGSHYGDAAFRLPKFPNVTILRADPVLTPVLWKLGIDSASAPLVAITIAGCVVKPGWLRAMLESANARPDCAAFGGPIDAPERRRLRDWAYYFCRYSGFMPTGRDREVSDLAGDNAIYRRAAIMECDITHGFWENLVHQQLRAKGWKLLFNRAAEIRLAALEHGLSFCRQRIQHGRYYGSTRPGTSGITRLLRACSAPLLPPFLLARIGKRILRQRREWFPAYVLSLPWLLVFIFSWSLGEASGYLWPKRRIVESALKHA